MAEFKVETNQLRNCATQIFSLERQLDAVNFKLAGLQLGSVLQIKASTALLYRINDCRRATGNQGDDLARLARGLEDIAELFDNCETNLSEPKTQVQADAQAAEDESWWRDILEVIDGLPVPIMDYLGELAGILDEVVGGITGTAVGWAVSLLQNTIGNFLEFDGFSPQMLYEMFGETAIDIGLGMGATALAAVILGVTPVGWVGVGVGLIGATAVWVVDSVVEIITGGRDISEVIVDLLWDSGMDDVVNDIADAVGDAAEAVGDAIETAGEVISDAAEAAGEAIDNAIDTVREGAEAAWNAAGNFVESVWPW